MINTGYNDLSCLSYSRYNKTETNATIFEYIKVLKFEPFYSLSVSLSVSLYLSLSSLSPSLSATEKLVDNIGTR